MKKTDKNQLNISLEVKNGNGGSGDDFYFYTNRDNLLIFFASGFIVPKNLNKKYYSDFGSSIENGIILLRDKLSLEYLNSLSESESSFPVCIKVTIPENYNGEVFFLMNDSKVAKLNYNKAPENYSGFLLPGIITLRDSFKIIFSDQNSLKEFTAREFEDINYKHFNLTSDITEFGGKNEFNISEFTGITDLSPIEPENFISIDRLAAQMTIMEKAAERFPKIFLLNLMEYYAIYFENFTAKGLKKINHTAIFESTYVYEPTLYDFTLNLLPYAVSCKNQDAAAGFNEFVKEFKLSKKLDLNNFINLFSVYCSIKTIIKFDSTNRNYTDYLNEFRNLFLHNITKSKKKISESEIEGLQKLLSLGEQFLNSEIPFEDISGISEKYLGIKYFLLFLKRFDYESITEFESEADEYNIKKEVLLIIQMISGIWSGYQGLPGRLKKHNPVTSGSFDALINYITGNQVYKFSAPKFIKDTLYAEELEYELIIDSINGIYGYNFITEKKDYHIGIRKLIIENIIPEKTNDLMELAKSLKMPGVIQYSASTPSKDLLHQRTVKDQSVFYSKSEFIVKTEFSTERFMNYMKDKVTESELKKVPLKLKLKIEQLYKIKEPEINATDSQSVSP